MSGYKPTPGEEAAFQRGLDERSEVMRLMGTEAYRSGDLATHNRVRRFFADAYGDGPAPVRTAMGPGQIPANPFGRR